MPARKGKGHVPPDRSKLYAVVERPTTGKQKDQITKTFATDLSWDDAERMKYRLAATRKTRYATVIEMPDPAAALDAKVTPDEFGDDDAEWKPLVETVADDIAGSSLAGKWPDGAGADARHAIASGTIEIPSGPPASGTIAIPPAPTDVDLTATAKLPRFTSSFTVDDGKVTEK